MFVLAVQAQITLWIHLDMQKDLKKDSQEGRYSNLLLKYSCLRLSKFNNSQLYLLDFNNQPKQKYLESAQLIISNFQDNDLNLGLKYLLRKKKRK